MRLAGDVSRQACLDRSPPYRLAEEGFERCVHIARVHRHMAGLEHPYPYDRVLNPVMSAVLTCDVGVRSLHVLAEGGALDAMPLASRLVAQRSKGARGVGMLSR